MDDDTDLCALMSDFLSQHQFAIEAAYDGRRGLARALDAPFDLVILDVMLHRSLFAVDLGGIHIPTEGSITLDNAAATKFNLTKGKVYEIALFQAERKQSQSSYKLTVGQFSRTHTECNARCGDGVVNGRESCDNGPDNKDDSTAATACTVAPFCGDAKVDAQFGEECDNGDNTTTYGHTTGCGPGCHKVPYCGDGKVDSLFDEECDDGDKNNDLGPCDTECHFVIVTY